MDEAMLFEAIHTITVPGYCKRVRAQVGVAPHEMPHTYMCSLLTRARRVQFIQRLRAEDERSIEIQMESVAEDSELSLGLDETTDTTLDRPPAPQGQQQPAAPQTSSAKES